MAVGASNIALVNLAIDCRQSVAVAYQYVYVLHLIATDVVELKNDRITFATVNAWVLKQIRPHVFPVPMKRFRPNLLRPRKVDGLIVEVILASVRLLVFLAFVCHAICIGIKPSE